MFENGRNDILIITLYCDESQRRKRYEKKRTEFASDSGYTDRHIDRLWKFGGGNATDAGQSVPAAAIDPNKIAVVAMGDYLVQDWDPAISYGVDPRVLCNVYETLLTSNPDGTYNNVLATECEGSEDGLTWTFKLRENVKFQDGTDFNADAVKYAIDRTIAMDKGGAYIWGPVKEIKVIDDYTVEFSLNYPVDLREIVSCQYAAFIYAPSAGEDLEESSAWFYECNMCGTGPYTLQEFSSGSHLILKKFDDYWKGWEGNHIEQIVFKSAEESTTRRQMIEGGEADLAFDIVASDAEAMADNANLSIEVTETEKNLQCFLNVEAGPFTDKKVRQAIAYSFPYQDVIDYVQYGKYATLPVDVIAPATLIGVTESIPYTYDMNKAKALLEEAGMAEGFEITASYHNIDEDTKKVLELWKSELAKLNVTLNIETNSWEVVYNKAKSSNPEERDDIFVAKTFADTNTSYGPYSTCVESGAGWNFSGIKNPEYDEKIEAAYQAAAFDQKEYITQMQEVGAEIADDCFQMNLYDFSQITAVSNNFHGFTMNPAYQGAVPFYDCYKGN